MEASISFQTSPHQPGEYQELPSDTDSDVTSAGSSGKNNDDLTYLGSRENLPTIENTPPDLSAIIVDGRHILKVFGIGIAELNDPRVIFNQEDNPNSKNIVKEEATQTETSLANVEMSGSSPNHPLNIHFW